MKGNLTSAGPLLSYTTNGSRVNQVSLASSGASDQKHWTDGQVFNIKLSSSEDNRGYDNHLPIQAARLNQNVSTVIICMYFPNERSTSSDVFVMIGVLSESTLFSRRGPRPPLLLLFVEVG